MWKLLGASRPEFFQSFLLKQCGVSSLLSSVAASGGGFRRIGMGGISVRRPAKDNAEHSRLLLLCIVATVMTAGISLEVDESASSRGCDGGASV